MNYAERKLRNARAQLVQAYPFFGALLLRQKVVETTECETMATDGKNLYFNAAWVTDRTMTELHAVCAHEALHPGFSHHLRRGSRDMMLWNQATDLVINPILKDAGLQLPQGVLLRDDCRGLTAEQVYAKLLREQPPPPPPEERSDDQGDEQDDGQGEGEGEGEPGQDEGTGDQGPTMPSVGGMGWCADGPECADPVERQQADAECKVALTQAAMAARAAGDLPGSLETAIKGALEPRADWREVLRRYMTSFAKSDYSWLAANRRFVASGMYLPSLRSEQLGRALLVVDASGSMSAPFYTETMLKSAASEVSAICADLQPEGIEVLVHDTRVCTVQSFEPGEEIEVTCPAGGGTCFAPVCEWINAAQEQYAVVIWFTDLETGDWERAAAIAPDVPIVWVDYTDSKFVPPFGDEVVRMQEDAR